MKPIRIVPALRCYYMWVVSSHTNPIQPFPFKYSTTTIQPLSSTLIGAKEKGHTRFQPATLQHLRRQKHKSARSTVGSAAASSIHQYHPICPHNPDYCLPDSIPSDQKRSKKYSRICLKGGETGSLEYIIVALLKTSSLPQLGSITGFIQIRTGAFWECMGS